MSIEKLVHVVAGTLILVSLALGAPASPVFVARAWLWLAAFVGANLLQSSFTGFCPAVFVLRKLGARSEAELAR